MRKLKEILEEENITMEKVWYNRHLVREEKIENGEHFLVEDGTKLESYQNFTLKSIWDGALNSARKMEKKYGRENLGPYPEFEWGELNGRLETLRWVLGGDWGEFYT